MCGVIESSGCQTQSYQGLDVHNSYLFLVIDEIKLMSHLTMLIEAYKKIMFILYREINKVAICWLNILPDCFRSCIFA